MGGCLEGILIVCGPSVSRSFGCYLLLVLITKATPYSLVYFLCLNWVLMEEIQLNFLFPSYMLSITLICLNGSY